MKLKVVLQKDKESGGYVVSCPALPGCHSQGDTKKEALSNIREAIEGWLDVAAHRGLKGEPGGRQVVEVAV